MRQTVAGSPSTASGVSSGYSSCGGSPWGSRSLALSPVSGVGAAVGVADDDALGELDLSGSGSAPRGCDRGRR